jgi:hypothetical protein
MAWLSWVCNPGKPPDIPKEPHPSPDQKPLSGFETRRLFNQKAPAAFPALKKKNNNSRTNKMFYQNCSIQF